MIYLQLLFRRFYSGSSSDDHCTLFADRNLININLINVREDPHSAYRPDRDFLILEVKARILAAAFHVLGLKSKDEKPTGTNCKGSSSYTKLLA